MGGNRPGDARVGSRRRSLRANAGGGARPVDPRRAAVLVGPSTRGRRRILAGELGSTVCDRPRWRTRAGQTQMSFEGLEPGSGELYTSRMDRLLASRRLLIAALFVTVFAVHVASPVMTSWDSRWSIPTAVSIVREGNTDLDEYRSTIEAQNFYGIDQTGGHLRTSFPLGVSLLAVPFVAIADLLNPHPPGAPPADTFSIQHAAKLERFIASFVIAAAAAVVFLTANTSLPALPALGLAALFAFGTSAWSVASRALWQHGPSMLLLAVALHLFVRARTEP